MRKDVFIKELEYLLQDIPDEDKADAIAYYQDYLEEAGPENEEKVIQDLEARSVLPPLFVRIFPVI